MSSSEAHVLVWFILLLNVHNFLIDSVKIFILYHESNGANPLVQSAIYMYIVIII